MMLLIHVKRNKTKLSKNRHPQIGYLDLFAFHMKYYLSDEASKIDDVYDVKLPKLRVRGTVRRQG